MLSVFSEQAPRDIKVYYAFRIYGKFILYNSIDDDVVPYRNNNQLVESMKVIYDTWVQLISNLFITNLLYYFPSGTMY